MDINEFNEYFNYFKNRYIEDSRSNNLFEGLRFNSLFEKKIVINALINDFSSDSDKICALFLIIKRLRNNLFHEVKPIDAFTENEKNFEVANNAIKKFLKLFNK